MDTALQLLEGIGVLAGSMFIGVLLVVGYPSLIKRIALTLYRHAERTERMQERHRTRVSEQWSKELEASNE